MEETPVCGTNICDVLAMLLSTDAGNSLALGTDNKLFVACPQLVISDLTNINFPAVKPTNPNAASIVAYTSTAGAVVEGAVINEYFFNGSISWRYENDAWVCKYFEDQTGTPVLDPNK